MTPAPDSDLARLGRHWLGWDADQGVELPLLKIEDLPVSVLSLTGRLRRFGFHAQLTAPFRLANGHSPLSLHHTAQALSGHLDALEFPGLYLSAQGGYLSLRPIGDTTELDRLRHVVDRVFAEFRAPPSKASLPEARRRSELNTEQMKAVIDRRPPEDLQDTPFQFTLTRRCEQGEADSLRRKLLPILMPNLPRPFRVQSLSLCGEDTNGWFHVIHRYPLNGADRTRAPDRPTLSTATPQVPLWS